MPKSTLNPVNGHRFFLIIPYLVIPFTLIFSNISTAQVAVNIDGTDPHPSAMLDVKSTNLGFLPPRVTLLNRPSSPATGLLIFQTDGSPGYYFYDGTSWQRLGTSLSDYWQPNAADIYYSSGRVAIGSTSTESNGLKVSNYVNGKAAVKGNVEQIPNLYATGMLGVMGPALMGVPLSVMNVGVLGIKPNAGNNGAAVYGWNNDDNPSNYGGIFISDGGSSNNNYAIYAEAKGAAINYSGQFKGRVLVEGNTGIAGSADSLSTLLSVQVKHTQASDSKAIEGLSIPKPGYGVGVFGSGGWKGLHGEANGNGYNGWVYGVQGSAVSGMNGTAVGVYGKALGGTVNWAGYFDGSCFIANGLKVSGENKLLPSILSEGSIRCEDLIITNGKNLILNITQKSQDGLEIFNQTDNRIEDAFKSDEYTDDLSLIEFNKLLLIRIDEILLTLEKQNKRIQELENQLKINSGTDR